MKYHYSRVPDIADHRDRYFLAAKPTHRRKVSIIGKDVPIRDQGQLGSCTGNSAAALVDIVLGVSTRSALMPYYGGRKIEGTVRQDAGAMMRDVMKSISKEGICSDVMWPYDIKKFKTKPSKAAYLDAATVLPRIMEYQRVDSLDSLKSALSEGRPVTFGFSVPEYFEGEAVAKGALVWMPTQNDKMVGGHEVVAVGYDDTVKTPFIWVRNSWGSSWGINGGSATQDVWWMICGQ